MFKKAYFYLLLSLFFISSRIYGAATPPVLQEEDACIATTNFEPIADSGYTETKISIEGILTDTSSIKDQAQLRKLLNLLYLKKELLNVFTAEKAARKTNDDSPEFDFISTQIIDQIKTQENELTSTSLQILENIEEFIIANGSKLCFSNLLLFFDFRKEFCKQYSETTLQIKFFIETMSFLKSENIPILSAFCEEIKYVRPQAVLLEGGYLDDSCVPKNSDKFDLLTKYFTFFKTFDMVKFQTALDCENLPLQMNKTIILLAKETQEKINKFSRLFQLSIRFNEIFNEKELISLFGNTSLFEDTYNKVYEKFYEQTETKETVLITSGPDKGKTLPPSLFKNNDTAEELHAKIVQINIFIESLKSNVHLQRKRSMLGKEQNPILYLKLYEPLVNHLNHAYSSQAKPQPIVCGYLQQLTTDLKEIIQLYREGKVQITPMLQKYDVNPESPKILCPKLYLRQYLIFLKQKYEIQLESLEKPEKQKAQNTTNKNTQSKRKPKKKKASTQKATAPKKVDLAPAPAEPEEPKIEDINPKVKIDKKPKRTDKSKKKITTPEHCSPKTEDLPSPAIPKDISFIAAEIEKALYEEKVIKETPKYKILVKSWGPLPSQGYTLILYNDPAIDIDPSKFRCLGQTKFDKFHYIPAALTLQNGTYIKPGLEKTFNMLVNPTQQIYLGPQMFALCIKGVMLPKFAFRHFTSKTDEQVMQVLNWSPSMGLHKGAFVFIIDTNTNECFHQCFHEFFGPIAFC